MRVTMIERYRDDGSDPENVKSKKPGAFPFSFLAFKEIQPTCRFTRR